MDNFQSIMLGRAVETDLTDDSWTHHYLLPSRTRHVPKVEHAGGFMRTAGSSISASWKNTGDGSMSWSVDAVAHLRQVRLPLPRKRPCFHDEDDDVLTAPTSR